MLNVEKKFYEHCQDVLHKDTAGISLYDLEYHPTNKILRVYIYRPETQNAVIEDCIHVDRLLSPFLESWDWVPATLTLEVSSPGLFRALKTIQHFQNVLLLSPRQKISVTLNHLWEGKQKKFRDYLKEVKEDAIVLEGDIQIGYEKIKKAQLDPEI